LNASSGNFEGYMTVAAGSMKFGADVSGTNDGLYINANNYWYSNGNFKVGDGTSYVAWNGSTMEVKGSITVTGGDAATQTYATTAASSSAATALTSANNYTSLVDAKVFTDSSGKLAVTPTPSGAGLYLGSTYMGYYDGGAWKTYMANNGNFYLTGTNGYLTWNAATDTLSIKGEVTATSGTIGGWLIGANSISRTIGSRSTTLDASTGFLTFGGDAKIVFDTGGSGIIDFLGSGGIQMLSTSLGILAIRGGVGYGAGNRASMAYGTTEALYAEHSTYSGWAGYFVGQVACTGNITAYYSDERLKTKISNIPNALDKIQKLNGFYYTNNDLAKTFGYTEDKIQIGVSAQEVKEVFPEIVLLAPFDSRTGVSKSGENYLTVDYTKLVPVLIEAIKELKAEIEELKRNK
jgi:hypothetical protein